MNKEHSTTTGNSRPPRVSVIMSFHNGGSAFGDALRSILGQSYTDFELLLCDDGSTDGSLQLAAGFDDSRIQLWSDGKRKGLAARLNECLDRAQGELIARMDADDISYPDRLRQQVTFLTRRSEIDVVGCPMLVVAEDGTPLGKRVPPLEHEGIIANPSLGFGLPHPTWMARATWYRRHRYNAQAIRYEDAELLYRAYPTSRFANLPTLLYGYREVRGGFRKRLATRLGRIRYLHARRRAMGLGLMLRAAIAETAKAASDGMIALTRTRYAMLRLREGSLTDSELSTWSEILSAGRRTT